MKFDNPKCPKCGKLASRIQENVLCDTGITFDEHGEADYDGDGTRVAWDTCEPDVDGDGRVTLHCECGEVFQAMLEF